MFLERIHDETVAQTSYLLGCQRTGIAIVVDPNRDLQRYLRVAERHHLKIAFVTETHIHADFVSGARELARVCDATLLLSAHGDAEWKYRFAESDGVRLVRDGNQIDVGTIRLDVRHTPGHTPEHICFVVTDLTVTSEPVGMLSGDFIFVGDVGRPDLLERVANARGSMDGFARQLFASVRATRDLPDYLAIWPGHGAGSACGKALGAMPSSTIGYERLGNWAFQISDEESFVRAVLAGQPEAPVYFAVMKRVNRDGPDRPRLGRLPEFDATALHGALASGASLVDVRPATEFAREHVPGSINIPFGGSFARWAGAFVPYDNQIVILAEDAGRMARARHAMTVIGLDRVVGWSGDAARTNWEREEGPLARVERIDVAALAADEHRAVFDVRAQSEWDDGRIPRAVHHFLGDLVEQTRDLPRDTPIAVHCQAGTRSAIAASVLQALGFTDVVDMSAGYQGWKSAGLPVTAPTKLGATTGTNPERHAPTANA